MAKSLARILVPWALVLAATCVDRLWPVDFEQPLALRWTRSAAAHPVRTGVAILLVLSM